MQPPYIVIVFCFIAAVVLTHAMCRLAPRIGLVDRPDGERKCHRRAMPAGGGLAVFIAVCLAVGGALLVSPVWRAVLWARWREATGLLLAALIVMAVGLADDRYTIRGRQKLLGQVLATVVLITFGLRIDSIGLFGVKLELGTIGGVLFTIFWLLGAVNSLNLLDGADGVATAVGMVLTAAIAVLAMLTGHNDIATIGTLFTAALAGFLVFNFPPAKIFLGDTGSMLIGLVVGALAIMASLKGAGTCLLIAPLAVWAIPIMDSSGAIVRRKLTGRSIYATDRAHFHHRLLDRFGDQRLVVGVMVFCCAVTAGGAISSVYFNNDGLAVLTVAGMALVLVVTRAFGRIELILLVNRLRSLVASLVTLRHRGAQRESSLQLQGSERWAADWHGITRLARQSGLYRLEMNISLPSLYEGFHAIWVGADVTAPALVWRIDIPLVVNEHCCGWIKASAQQGGADRREVIDQLLQATSPIERRLAALLSGASVRAAAASEERREVRDERKTVGEGFRASAAFDPTHAARP